MEKGMAGGRKQKIIPVGEFGGIDNIEIHYAGYRFQVSEYRKEVKGVRLRE